MVLEVLGSGGSATTPKIFCHCPACKQGRKWGGKYARLGPSVFIHGPNILIDTPEEISIQINRSDITDIKACFYSHWHPDHTAGRRIFLSGEDLNNEPPRHRCTPVYLFAYVISKERENILIIMDELNGWLPSDELKNTEFDLVYLPFGIFNYNPIAKKKIYPDDYFLYEEEATIDETLEIIGQLKGKQFILSHIEEMDGITLDLAESLEQHYSDRTGKSIKMAWDGMKISLEPTR